MTRRMAVAYEVPSPRPADPCPCTISAGYHPSMLSSGFRWFRFAGMLVAALALTASCTTGEESVRLASPAPTSTAEATPAPTSTAEAPRPRLPQRLARTRSRCAPAAPSTASTSTRPTASTAWNTTPITGKSMVIDGRHGGIRFYHRRGTGQSVLVAVWSDRAHGAEERLERYEAHTGDVTPGRTVHGAEAVWELRERSAPEASTVTNLSVLMPDGTQIWLSGVNIPDVSLLYEFLTRIEDAPGSLRPKPTQAWRTQGVNRSDSRGTPHPHCRAHPGHFVAWARRLPGWSYYGGSSSTSYLVKRIWDDVY